MACRRAARWAGRGNAGLGKPRFRGGWRDFFQVRARDAELKGAAGDAVLSVAEVTATLSLGALVTGRLAPLELHLSQPRLALLRDSEGRLAIDRPAGDGTPAPAGNPADVAKAMHFLTFWRRRRTVVRPWAILKK